MTSWACWECGAVYASPVAWCPGCAEFSSCVPVPDAGKVHWQRRSRRLVTSKELAKRPGRGKKIDGYEWLGSLPPDEWTILIWGIPGKGKTTLALRLSAGLAAAGERVLYCSPEQGHAESLSRVLVSWEIREDRIIVSDARDSREVRQDVDEVSPDVLVLDSVTALGGSAVPHPKSIWIVQSTKDGGYRGSAETAHYADCVVCVMDHGVARVDKSRFGDTGEFEF